MKGMLRYLGWLACGALLYVLSSGPVLRLTDPYSNLRLRAEVLYKPLLHTRLIDWYFDACAVAWAIRDVTPLPGHK